MTENSIRFDDGAEYEHRMGRWSLLLGTQFLDWIGAPMGQRWVDVGCGNGAFTELIAQRCAPTEVHAFDPSKGQLDYARTRLPAGTPVNWHIGDAMHLPLADASVDAAVMALVLFFVPDPAVGVAQMCRVVRPGGLVAAYHWDILGGGFPFGPIGDEVIKMGALPATPPRADASTREASTKLWVEAGLSEVRSCQIAVQRSFDSFDDYWDTAVASNFLQAVHTTMQFEQIAQLKASVRARLHANEAGPLVVHAWANAICGIKR